MNPQQIRKLPGTKKEFPLVKSTIDNKRVKLAKPAVSATKPKTANPEIFDLVPIHSAKADVAPLLPKREFGHRGFDSTSIRATSATSRDKNIHPRDWKFSPKPEVASAKKMDGADVKPKPFKVKPVPRSHYVEPYPPLFTSKKAKDRTIPVDKKMKKTLELPTVPSSSTAEVSPVAVQFQPEPAETVKDQATAENHPGLASRIWHSIVGPILLPRKQEPDEKSSAGKDAEEQLDDQQEVDVFEDPQVFEDESDSSETLYLDVYEDPQVFEDESDTSEKFFDCRSSWSDDSGEP